jgi:NAD(P)-dependent dehydrogenase (short-subunit alcohol dehydrogenase family)
MALAQAGVRVCVSARSIDELERVADEITASGGEAFAHAVDVTDAESVGTLARAARDYLGAVSILVNNAGTAVSAPIHRITLQDWERIMAVNATGTFLCTKAFLPTMVQGGWGRIVNVASVAGVMGAPYTAAYAASKHAVVGFTRSAAA